MNASNFPLDCWQGLALLILSAILHSLNFKEALFLLSIYIYIVAVGQRGRRPCIQAFGANIFDGEDPEESEGRRLHELISWIWDSLFHDGSCIGSLLVWTSNL